tara:strand:+ start:4172 stop:4369 length:198 start_codon:yes stop_codon:yes gene_type:complete
LNDELVHKKEENAKRQAKKSCKPKDSRYVDGWEKHRQAGKGDKNRLPGWSSPAITKRLNKIFGKK